MIFFNLKDLKKDIDHLCHNNKNSFFKNNKEIVETLTKYSIYDVCGVLKQLIRDLPDPLLSYQLLEAFLLVPSNYNLKFTFPLIDHFIF